MKHFIDLIHSLAQPPTGEEVAAAIADSNPPTEAERRLAEKALRRAKARVLEEDAETGRGSASER